MTAINDETRTHGWVGRVALVAALVTLVIAGYAAFATHHPGWIAAAMAASFAVGGQVGPLFRQSS